MSISALDSKIFRALFGSQEMRNVFEERALISRYLEVERAIAKVQAELGIIPKEAADAICQYAKLEHLNLDRYAEDVKRVGFPIVPLVKQLAEVIPDGWGEYSHWGATTQDVMDTALALQLYDAISIVRSDLKELVNLLVQLAKRYRNTPMVGRSQLQQALPITFGYKVAVWLSMIKRHLERLEQLKPRLLVGQFSGAVGTLASLGDHGLEVQEALCEELGLVQPEISWHTARDCLAEVVSFLGLVNGSLGKIANDIILLAQTEVAELKEPFVLGRGSSSTMPQKRNPVSSELIIAAAKAVQQQVATMFNATIHDHERASGSWMLEWLVVPEAFVLTSGALKHAKQIMAGLEVDEKRMVNNLELTKGLIVSEAVMMALAPFMGRQKAHDLMIKAAQQASHNDESLYKILIGLPEITKHLSWEQLKALTNPRNYTGLAVQMVDRVLASVS